jgi:hypothetical protein
MVINRQAGPAGLNNGLHEWSWGVLRNQEHTDHARVAAGAGLFRPTVASALVS